MTFPTAWSLCPRATRVGSGRPRGHRVRTGLAAISGASAAFVLSGAVLTVGARMMARIPLVPVGRQRSDATVRAVYPDRVHLDATAETQRPGCLAIRQAGGAVHVRLGDVVARPTATSVARTLLATDSPRPADRLDLGAAGTNGYFWAGDPATAHGLDFDGVIVDSPVGSMPAWQVPPARGRDANGTWAVLVHGHGATRGETLRVMPLLAELGITSLAITYRNDVGAAESADRMHHLGAAEWEDAEAAIDYALAQGARRVVLIGWSMGGGIVLRTSVLSAHRDRIAALVADSPAVDWQDILDYHAKALRAPRPMRRLALWMMRSPWGARAVRLHEPIALAQMRPAFYGEHLRHRTLLLHALEDRTVPPGPSAELAALRPDLVQYVPFPAATHTREWNTDPQRYERVLARFLVDVLGLDVDVDAMALPVRDPGAPAQERSSGLRL